MKATIQPSTVKGTITVPASKSAMQRACAAALLKKGKTVIHNPGHSADDLAAIDTIVQLGADVERSGVDLVVRSKGVKPVAGALQCGESGLSVRMFTSIAALSDEEISISGKGSLLKRPMDFFDRVLPQLGVYCNSNQGFLPLMIKGPLQPKNIEVDGSLSSQFLTGLLFAFSGAGAEKVSIRVNDLNSKPYIDLTLQVMTHFGMKVPENRDYREFYFGSSSIASFDNDIIHYTVEGDWSSASFLLVAGAIAGSISVKGLDVFSNQADKAILQALMSSGANMSIREDGIEVSGGRLKAFHFNALDCPDLFPPLVSLGASCEGTTVIEGVHRLFHKESNRALSLQEEFRKLGVEIGLQDDLMIIKGPAHIRAASVDAHGDHRIAMACAVAALKGDGNVQIYGAEAVHKSYPAFWDDLALISQGPVWH